MEKTLRILIPHAGCPLWKAEPKKEEIDMLRFLGGLVCLVIAFYAGVLYGTKPEAKKVMVDKTQQAGQAAKKTVKELAAKW